MNKSEISIVLFLISLFLYVLTSTGENLSAQESPPSVPENPAQNCEEICTVALEPGLMAIVDTGVFCCCKIEDGSKQSVPLDHCEDL